MPKEQLSCQKATFAIGIEMQAGRFNFQNSVRFWGGNGGSRGSIDNLDSGVAHLIIRLAEKLMPDQAAIVAAYRGGETHAEIAGRYGDTIQYDRSPGVAGAAVAYIIQQLIPDKERERLEIQHKSVAGRRLKERGEGIFAQTADEREKFRQQAMQAREATISNAEWQLFQKLCEQCKHSWGRHMGSPNYQEIANRFSEAGYARSQKVLRKWGWRLKHGIKPSE